MVYFMENPNPKMENHPYGPNGISWIPHSVRYTVLPEKDGSQGKDVTPVFVSGQPELMLVYK